MCEDLPIGGEIQFKHIDFNVKIPAPFKHKKIGMIAGACLNILIGYVILSLLTSDHHSTVTSQAVPVLHP